MLECEGNVFFCHLKDTVYFVYCLLFFLINFRNPQNHLIKSIAEVSTTRSINSQKVASELNLQEDVWS